MVEQASVLTTFDTRTDIETPENVILTFDLAGPGTRLGSFLTDLAIRLGLGYGLAYILGMFIPILGAGLPLGGILVGVFMLEWGYAALFEGLWKGQTPGKRMFHLRVIKEGGYPIHFYDAVLRNFLLTADFLPFGYGAAFLTMSLTPKMQRIGDLVAGTIVVRTDAHRFRRNLSAIAKVEPIEPTDCAGRFHVSERTLDLIEQLLARRDGLGMRRLEEIASILAVPIAERLGYQFSEPKSGKRDLLFLRRVLKTFSKPGGTS